MKSTNELRQEAKEVIMDLNEGECLAILLMIKDPWKDDQILSKNSREDFLAALAVLERYNHNFPDNERCQTAIEFIKKTGGLNRE